MVTCKVDRVTKKLKKWHFTKKQWYFTKEQKLEAR